MEKIINDIKSINNFNLKIYYELVDKYSEKEVILAFKNLLISSKNKKLILNKYSEAYIHMELNNSKITDSEFEDLCSKYDIDYLSAFLIQYKELMINTIDENKINWLIKKLDFDEEEEEKLEINSNYVEDDSIRMYLTEIANFPLLTNEEEKKYFSEYKKTGNIDLRNKIANSNLRLVISIAKKYKCYSIDMLDLIQEGNCGLMKAIDKFDVNKGFKFSTYASWWIRQSITRSIANDVRNIRVPVHVYDKILKYKKFILNYEQTNGKYPNENIVAKELNWSLETTRAIRRDAANMETTSLNVPVGEEEDSTLGDFIPDTNLLIEDQYYRDNELVEIFEKAFKTLSPREVMVLKYRFGLNGRCNTLEEVGREFEVTRERIRQIEAKALRRLRNPSRAKYFDGYR